MSLEVILAVNGQVIDRITITNIGPPDGLYPDGDHPGGTGERLYTWSTANPRTSGQLRHRRADGAHALAGAVLHARASRVTPNHDTPLCDHDPMDSDTGCSSCRS